MKAFGATLALGLALLIHALRHCVQCDEASFEVRYFGCKAENLIAHARTKSATDFDRFRKRRANLTDSFEEKGQCLDLEVLSVKDEFIAPSSHLVSLFSTG